MLHNLHSNLLLTVTFDIFFIVTDDCKANLMDDVKLKIDHGFTSVSLKPLCCVMWCNRPKPSVNLTHYVELYRLSICLISPTCHC